MSKVDDSSDAQRIREMNEAQFRRRADNNKRSDNARLERSFQQVVTQRGQRAQAQQVAEQQTKNAPQEQLAKQVLDKVRQEQPRAPHELARRAALSNAMRQGLTKKASADIDQTQNQATARTDELATGSEVELEHVDKVAREDDERSTEKVEERQAEIELERREGDPLAPIGRDDRRRDPRQGQGRGQDKDDRNTGGVGGAKGAGGTNAPRLPPEVVRQIVSAIYKGVSVDGRTHMQVTLKGGMLDGVSLSVRSEGGKVSCEFSGCGRDLSRLLDSTKGVLARGLSKRGLKLERLTAR